MTYIPTAWLHGKTLSVKQHRGFGVFVTRSRGSRAWVTDSWQQTGCLWHLAANHTVVTAGVSGLKC